MNKSSTKAVAAVLLSTALLALSACTSSSTKHAGNIDSIRNNPSPAMHTLSQRFSDRSNTRAMVIDTDLRSMQEDFDHIFHLNRPSRLHSNIKPN